MQVNAQAEEPHALEPLVQSYISTDAMACAPANLKAIHTTVLNISCDPNCSAKVDDCVSTAGQKTGS